MRDRKGPTASPIRSPWRDRRRSRGACSSTSGAPAFCPTATRWTSPAPTSGRRATRSRRTANSSSASKEFGGPPETDWAYDTAKFTQKPPQQAYTEGEKHQALKYERVSQGLDQLKGCLASGLPFVFGFSVYESFQSPDVAKTGDAPLPAKDEQLLGGHAVLAVGYDDATGRFLVRNSWGDGWGQKGYFTLPYEYLTNRGLASDFWAIQTVE